ncbi:Uncharacterised protein [Actinobacillus pleuropneumoniae]|nr:Uncharacterised protein [Actinobacillus pleuropneumoniae]
MLQHQEKKNLLKVNTKLLYLEFLHVALIKRMEEPQLKKQINI